MFEYYAFNAHKYCMHLGHTTIFKGEVWGVEFWDERWRSLDACAIALNAFIDFLYFNFIFVNIKYVAWGLLMFERGRDVLYYFVKWGGFTA